MPIERSVESYFLAYMKRYPEKSRADAARATRKWIQNFIRFALDSETVPEDLNRKIEEMLQKLAGGDSPIKQQRLL